MTTIKLKNGSGAPTAGDLAQGEPALDLTNKRLYTEDSGGTVIEVGTNPTSVTTGDITATGTATFAGLTTTADVSFGDNDKAIFGAGSDLQIYHDGVHSYIADVGTGVLFLRGESNIVLENNSGSNYFEGTSNGASTIYYAGNPKLATTSTGIDVTGTVTSTSYGSQLATTLFEQNVLKSSVTASSGAFVRMAVSSASNPTYAFEDDTDTGVFTSGANTLNFGTAGTERLRIESGGDISFYEDTGTTAKLFWDASAERLGLGTSSPSRQLSIYGTNDGYMSFNGGRVGNHEFIVGTESSGFVIYDETLDTYRLVIDQDSGNVGIGTSNPDTSLHVTTPSGTKTELNLAQTAVTNYRLSIPASTDALTFVYGASTERMRIDSSGNVGIGNTSPSAKFTNYKNTSISGSAGATLSLEDDSQPRMMMVADSSTSYISSFDSNPITFSVTAGNFSSSTGTERMRIDSSGNLLVGKSSSAINTDGVELLNSGRMFLTTTSLAHVIRRKSTDGALVEFQKDGTTVGTINTNAGAFVFKGASASAPVQLQTHDGNEDIEVDPDGFIKMETAGSERLRIDSSGAVLVGATSGPTNRKFYVEAAVYPAMFRMTESTVNYPTLQLRTAYATGGQTATQIDFRNGADATVGTVKSTVNVTSYNTSSDQRLKENIVDAPSASDDIDAIQVRSFDWKADGSHQKYGMVAQELQNVAPEAVTGDADSDDMMGVDYSKLVPMLVKEIQSLRARVAQLEGVN